MEEKYYSGQEVLKIAVEMEKDGYHFYKEFAEKTKNEDVAYIFRKVAKDEQDHINVIENNIKPLFGGECISEQDQELIIAYLKSIEKQEVFPDSPMVDDLVKKINKDTEAIDFAIESERKSIDFYKKLGKANYFESGRKAFDKLVEEEKRHLEDLQKLKEGLS